MAEPFDPTRYNRPPIVNAASGFALAHALISAMPPDPPPMLLRSATVLRGHAVELQTAWISQDRVSKTEERRSADLWIDSAWSALVGRIDSYAMLPHATFPLAARAEEIRDHLVGSDGLVFLTLSYDEEWAESEKRITKMNDLGLADDIDKIAGKEFRENLLAAHEAYGKIVGTTEASKAAPVAKLAEPLRNLQAAIGRYARQWAAVAEDSPTMLEKAVAALAPIDRLRARQASSGTDPKPEEPVDPTTPIPDLPDLPEPPLTD